MKAAFSFSLTSGTLHVSHLTLRIDENADMVEDLDRKRARRGHRGVVTKYVQEIKAFPEMPDDTTRRTAVLRGLLRAKQELLSSSDEEILSLCDTEEIEGEITETDEIIAKIEEVLVDIKHIIRDEQRRAESQITSSEGLVVSPINTYEQRRKQ